MIKRIPVTLHYDHDDRTLFKVITLCGLIRVGNTPVMEMGYEVTMALSHSEACPDCAERWDILNRPGTILAITHDE
jgi:hypothetical protein